jgi:hypothetical protein
MSEKEKPKAVVVGGSIKKFHIFLEQFCSPTLSLLLHPKHIKYQAMMSSGMVSCLSCRVLLDDELHGCLTCRVPLDDELHWEMESLGIC